MYEVSFVYNGVETIIQGHDSETMKDIIKKFNAKSLININSVFFLYNGEIINEELTINDLPKPNLDTNKISILVYDKNTNISIQNKGLVKSKEIICPECKQNCLFKFDGVNTINLYGCKNNHEKEILIEEFENTQNIDASKIICCNYNNCNNNKFKSYNKQFYRCLTCKNNLCLLCKSTHSQSHYIIDFDKINYFCDIHNGLFTSYCKNCKKNLCMLCENEHNKDNNHNIIDYKRLIENKNELNNEMNKFKKKIDKFNDEIKKIIELLNDIIKKMNIYYEINNNFLNNYEPQNKNFEILQNIKEIKNNILMKDIEEIINEKNIIYKFEKIMQITNNIDSNEVIIRYKILNDINNQMSDYPNSFISNNPMQAIGPMNMGMQNNPMQNMGMKEVSIFGKRFIDNDEKNCEFIYEGKKYNLKENIYVSNNIDMIEIRLIGINNITNICGMFEKCSSLVSITGISKIKTSKITNMSSLFDSCSSLKLIDDISKWDTSNVTNISSLFRNCESLISIPDISKWNTRRVIYMNDIFRICTSLQTLPDISKWDTSQVMYMNGLFSFCSSLKSLPDISKWKTDNVTLMTGMFYGCFSLQSIPDISKWNISKVNYLGNIFAQCNSLKIPFQYQFNLNCSFYNLGFSDYTGNRITIILSPDTRIDEALKIYLLTIGKYEHINKTIYNFYYGSYHLKFGDFKTIEEVFKNILTPKIIVK